jgi:hypothetical protein
MKNKLISIAKSIYSVKTWRWTVLIMLTVLITSVGYYSLNFFESSRPEISISKKELEKNKINKNLNQSDEVESEATFEDFNLKFKSLSKKIPKAEWKLTEKELTKEEYEAELKKYNSNVRETAEAAAYYYMLTGEYSSLSSDNIPYPQKKEVLKYSMKTFFDDILKVYDTDSTDFDTKNSIIDKIDHFIELTDKKGTDTILVDKFRSVLENSKNLSLNEIKSVEILHKSVTKTKLIFSTSTPNSPKERQVELFKMYESAANNELTEERFVQLDELVNKLKTNKIKDTIVVLNVLVSAMNTDFSKYKEKEESIDELEIQCINDFFMGGKIDFNEDNVEDNYKKYKELFSKKIKEANLEKKAREIQRSENRMLAWKWIFNSSLFFFIAIIIVLLAKINLKLKTYNI